MSNIFNAVAKNGTIDLSDLTPVEIEDATGPAEPEQLSSRFRFSSPAASSAHRSVRLRASALSPVFPSDQGQQHAAEQYRLIRTKILHHAKKPQVIVVSSASSGDGKTVTAINVAAAMALKSDSQILLIDGDLRFPTIATELDLPAAPGLTDILSGKAQLDSALIRCEQFPQLFVISAGTPAPNPSELLDSAGWHDLLGQVRSRFTTVILDAPPIATVADHELLQLTADSIILVIRPDHSDRAAVLEALNTIPKQKLLGVVLNCVDDWWLWKAPGSGYYRVYGSNTTDGLARNPAGCEQTR
ncbi:MAG: CpsD/CapB family tyrosine-protein kinase [Bryobacteraceae bacterium]